MPKPAVYSIDYTTIGRATGQTQEAIIEMCEEYTRNTGYATFTLKELRESGLIIKYNRRTRGSITERKLQSYLVKMIEKGIRKVE